SRPLFWASGTRTRSSREVGAAFTRIAWPGAASSDAPEIKRLSSEARRARLVRPLARPNKSSTLAAYSSVAAGGGGGASRCRDSCRVGTVRDAELVLADEAAAAAREHGCCPSPRARPARRQAVSRRFRPRGDQQRPPAASSPPARRRSPPGCGLASGRKDKARHPLFTGRVRAILTGWRQRGR